MNMITLLSGLTTAAIAVQGSAATVTILNGDFESTAGVVADIWQQVDGGGVNSVPSNYSVNNTPDQVGNFVMHIKSDGGNYVQQGLTASDEGAMDAGTFAFYGISFDYGYRSESATNGDHTLRVSLWNTTDDVELTGEDLLITDPGAPTSNALTPGSFNLSYVPTGLAGKDIALRITSTSDDLELDSWQRTAMLDNVAVTATAVPEPGSLALLGLGAVAMLRRRR